jgi:hypothetical protein
MNELRDENTRLNRDARQAARAWRREGHEVHPTIAGEQNATSLCAIGQNGELIGEYHNARWTKGGGSSRAPNLATSRLICA